MRSAFLWSGADIFLRQGLAFLVAVALARLLTPEEFGTIAALALFIGVAGVFVDSGFGAALIQRQDVTHTDESTVFWFNIATGAVTTILLCLLAPVIAAFFGMPVLIPLAMTLSLAVLFNAAGAIHATLLSKRLDFRTQLKVGAIATVVSGAVAIALAWNGFGIWALAAQTVVSAFATTVLLWAFHPWRPKAEFSTASARNLFGFGGYLLAAGLLDTAYARIYTLLIGKHFGVRDLGLYNRADSTKQVPIGILTGVLSRVALPIFSAAASDAGQLRRGVQMAVRGMMLVSVPMMLGMAAVAEALLVTIFGEQWLPSAPALQVLCLAGALWPLHVINLNALMAQGHGKLFFRLEVIKKVVGIVFVAVGSFYGILGIAWSQVAFGLVGFAINAYYTGALLQYGAAAQARDFLPIAAAAVPMALAVRELGQEMQAAPAFELLVQVGVGVMLFLALGWAFRLVAVRDAVQFFARRRAAVTAAP